MKECWYCKSKNYIETSKYEYCPDCGIRCDYPGGPNEKYRIAKGIMDDYRKYLDGSINDGGSDF